MQAEKIKKTIADNKVKEPSFYQKLKAKFKLSRDKNKFMEKWISIMLNLKLYNVEKNTFSLFNVEKTPYGYKSEIFIVDGLKYPDLEAAVECIEGNYGCMMILNKKKRSNVAYADFIFEAPEDLKFKPVLGLKPWEIYIGNDFSGKPIIVDIVKYPHILISGGTRSGKSKMTDCIITNLVANCTAEELELYLIQVAKSDLVLYEDLDHTKAFASNVDEGLKVLEHIDKIMTHRDKLIRPYRKKAEASNYLDYNKANPKEQFTTVFVMFDETSSIFLTQGDDKSTKAKKEKMVAHIKRIAQYGAGLGVFFLISLQRPTAENLNPFVKSQSTTIISLRQNNSKSSEVATDDSNAAVGLEQREFVYLLAGTAKYGMVPLIKDKEVFNNIKHKTGHRFSNFFRQSSCNETPVNITGKEKIEIETPKELPAPNTPLQLPAETKSGKEKI